MLITMPSSKRLEARITPDLHALLKQAAELEGRSLTDFVIQAVQHAAQASIERAHIVRLSVADQHTVANALLSPPKPNAALKRAFKHSKALLASSDD